MEPAAAAELRKLEPLVGQWTTEAVAPWAPAGGERGHAIFQWGPGEAFLVQRWETPVDAAPDGVAIFAVDEESGELVQHYFDSRGVVRRYATSIEDGVWSLRKLTPALPSASWPSSAPMARRSRAPGRRPTTASPGSTTSPSSIAKSFNAAMAAEDRYVTATGVRGLTRFYDSIVAVTMRESLFRGRLAQQVLAGLAPGDRIADVGAGTGTFAISLAAAAPAAEVVAVDGDPAVLAIAEAKEGAAAIEWKRGLANELPLAGGSCERVTMSLLLHHLDADGKRAALTEAHRVLGDGGSLHIADWGRPQDPLMRAGLFTLAIFDGFDGIRDHAAGRLPSFIEAAGFGPVECHDRLRTAWGSLELLSARRAG
jgi:SAM-dependent methyltransferase